ncbi:MAG: glycosyltransferase family 2 protein [Candidatus Parcubacteria bacterium]|nr:glycosyltransferase family 2 protein [Candidatus Parcubacteria bacterium]
MKHVAISLLNFNGKNNTLDCLKSLENIRKMNFESSIIVIDNASVDGSVESIKQYISNGKHDGIKIIENKKNLGFSGGHNVAIKYAFESGADYILVLNNDTYVDHNFLKELLIIAEEDNNIGILVPKIYFAPGFEYHKDRYSKSEIGKVLWYAGGEMDWANVIGHNRGVDIVDKRQFDNAEETELATGCCMMIKREVFDKVGMFDDKYYLYYEDADLTMRTKRKGFKVVYVPGSIIWHKNAGSAGGSGSVLQDYYITRNRLLFGFRYAPVRSKLALFRESISLLLGGRQWQKRGVADFYLGRMGKGSYKI